MVLGSRILYLGIDAPPGVFHYPVIRAERIDSLGLRHAFSFWERSTHMIFTSKNAVRLWPNGIHGKLCIAIGEATANEIRTRGGDPWIASEATQEGVAALLETLDLRAAFLLYPRSKAARPFLAEYLQSRGLDHYVFDLYEPVFQKIEPAPDLADFDEIVFTSPSTVQAFLRIYPSVPARIALTPIGPITKKSLEEYFSPRI